MSGHWFGRSQFSIPSDAHYLKLKKSVPGLDKPYEKLLSWYHEIRDGEKRARRYFQTTKGENTDVWDYKVVQPYPDKHPCEKPSALMEKIIQTSSKKGDLVMDTFVGSGSTPIAALKLNRNFVGCEMGKIEFAQALKRVNKT